MATSVPIGGPLQIATFVDRPNRFVVRCRRQPEDELVTAHLADPGRLKELLIPDCRIWLRHSAEDSRRSTEWSAVLVENPNGDGLVSLDTILPNRLVASALENGEIEELADWSIERTEVPYGRSRFDFLLSNVFGQKMMLEVKSVTMVENGIGLFPDAPTERGTRHVQKLTDLAGQGEYQSTLLFIVQRIDAQKVMAAKHIDPDFADALRGAMEGGVRILARRCQITLQEVLLGVSLPIE